MEEFDLSRKMSMSGLRKVEMSAFLGAGCADVLRRSTGLYGSTMTVGVQRFHPIYACGILLVSIPGRSAMVSAQFEARRSKA